MPARLPPLNSLRAFEAVVRCGSLAAAAAELGVVRGAVRQHLDALEKHFGLSLFQRDGRSLVPSPEARRLAEAAAAAFDIIGRAARELAPAGATFRLGVLSPLAETWLVPRLPRLDAAGLGFEVEIVRVPATHTFADSDELDALILGGEYRPMPDIVGIRFMDDEFGPVASPALAEAKALAQGVRALAKAVALTSRTVPALWDDWFRESGNQPVRFARRREFEDLALAIGAARAGLGVTVAPRRVIEDDLAAGVLAAPYGFVARPAGYTFCHRVHDPRATRIAAMRDWLLAEGRQKI